MQKRESNVPIFEIPMEEELKNLSIELSAEKKKEIFDFVKTHNKLRSTKEYKEIREQFCECIQIFDLNLMKILISETFFFDSDDSQLEFKINKENKTATLYKVVWCNGDELIIPRAINYELNEYLVTDVIRFTGYYYTIVKFEENSKVNTIYPDALSYSSINEIYFPNSLIELKEGWCNDAKSLEKIIISPSNNKFVFKEDKYLLGKTDTNNDVFDTFLFVKHDVNEISIPSNIKIIGSYSFSSSRINEISIPASVTKICQFAFAFCKNLNKVIFKEDSNLQIIDNYAFRSSNIEEISIPKSVIKICKGAFCDCVNLVKFEIPTNSCLQIIEKSVFSNSSIEEIYLPNSLIELKEGWCKSIETLNKIIVSPSNNRYVFKEDKYLLGKTDINNDVFDVFLFIRRNVKEISIPSNIKIIGSYSFSHSLINKIFIPASVTKICKSAFFDCTNLNQVEFQPNSKLQILEVDAFTYSNIKEISIPASVTRICETAFKMCYSLSKVEFQPNSNLQTISGFDSSKINQISIPASVIKICDGAFANCTNLVKVEIPTNSKLQTIGESSFYYSSLNEISIPASVRKICESAFSNCKNLVKVEIPTNSNLQTIEKDAFANSKIEEIYLPNSLIELKEGWCRFLNKLNKITVSPSNNRFMFKDDKYLLGKTDFNNDVFDIFLFAGRKVKEISIPSNIKIIGSYSFSHSMINKIFIPSSVTTLCKDAFTSCKNLNKVMIPENSNLTTIENDAFYGSSIKSFSIPGSVSKICDGAFNQCSELTIIEFSGDSKIQLISELAFRELHFFKGSKMIVMIPASLENSIHKIQRFYD